MLPCGAYLTGLLLMSRLPVAPAYAPREERLNAITHGLGALLAVVAGFFLLQKGLGSLSSAQTIGLLIYSISLVVLFLASTLYHSIQSETLRTRLKQLDHGAIYLLIAGTYTPFLMISLSTDASNDKARWLLWALWLIAVLGIIFKLFFVHRFARLSLAAYLIMGWLALLILPDIYAALPRAGFFWLVAGGASYTLGTIFYAAKRLPYSHAIWHLFVLLGAACHCWAIYAYVLP